MTTAGCWTCMQDGHVLWRKALLRYDIISRYDTFFLFYAIFDCLRCYGMAVGYMHSLFMSVQLGVSRCVCRIRMWELFAAFIRLYANICQSDCHCVGNSSKSTICRRNCTPSNFGLALALPSKRAPKRRLSCPAGSEQRSTFRLNANGTMHLVARALWTTYHHA